MAASNAKDDVPAALFDDLIAVAKRPDVLSYLGSTHGKSSSQYYFVAKAESIYNVEYVHPSSDDILRCRIVTRGMSKARVVQVEHISLTQCVKAIGKAIGFNWVNVTVLSSE